jgi:hypothetical protein
MGLTKRKVRALKASPQISIWLQMEDAGKNWRLASDYSEGIVSKRLCVIDQRMGCYAKIRLPSPVAWHLGLETGAS